MTWGQKLKTEVDYPFRLDNQSGPAYFSVARHPQVVAGFTLRSGGFSTGPFAAANLGYRIGDQESQVRRNREALLAKLGGGAFRSLVTVRQVHGCHCLVVDGGQSSGDLGQFEADALVTGVPGILLGVLTADCLPLILVDRRRRAVAVVHAGWRGLVRGVVLEALREMQLRFAVPIAELEVYVGPAIGSCCFAVGSEVLDIFRRLPELEGRTHWYARRSSGWYLDLLAVQRAQLFAAGVVEEHFYALDLCTCCHDFCFSYRRDHGISGRQMAFVGLLPT